ncbi:hypothetical protein [Clostridium manihotivorum]|uniref:Uncharacterized protein n=1 Tax=Clostridium manihotivorum TaxID=2320868 RepID=A0A410DUS2_9CLOT|nr:hypothetical protein [Clostridium manihotivorum]QAA32829.1 hypothetical protein C1I91_14910 [Clostridium manihotivorum]
MKKKVLVMMTTAILTIGAVTAVYAKENNTQNNFGFGRGMMYQNNINSNGTYNQMIDLMKNNGFEDAAKAMENRDFDSMNNFMNNITDEQYNQMTDIMKNNGYEGMAKMMGSVSRQEMVDIHNSMMGR